MVIMSYAGSIIAFPAASRDSKAVFFNHHELSLILDIYGRMVSAGMLKDYAISEARDQISFAFFRRAAERPLYRVVKNPARGRKKEPYVILGPDGRVLQKGKCLKTLLKFFEPKMIRLVKA